MAMKKSRTVSGIHNRIKEMILLSKLYYMFCNWLRWDRKGTFLAFTQIPVEILLPLMAAWLNKSIVDLIIYKASLSQFLNTLGLFFLLFAIVNWINRALHEKMESFQQVISIHYAVESFEKLLSMDYEILESFEGRQKFERCQSFALHGRRSDGAWAVVRLTGLVKSILGIMTYLALFTAGYPLLALVIIIVCGLEFAISQKAIRIAAKTEDQMTRQEMRFAYFFRLSHDLAAGKDIRLTGAANWLIRKLDDSIKAYYQVMRWFTKKTTELTVARSVCALIRDGACFFFLIQGVLHHELPASDFVFYFSLFTGFSGWLNEMSGHISSLRRIAVECEKYQEFMHLGKLPVRGHGLPCPNKIGKIEFRDVSFAYENSQPILQHVSFIAETGDRIAIVGENGAGKTTLMKLLCGLYAPTSGKILINDIDLNLIDKESYYDSLGAVFQDYTLLPGSLLDNICMTQASDREKAEEVLDKVGLLGRVKALEQGLDTRLHKQMDSDAIALSGGETQRLLFGRVLYKNAPILLLDEPTAALDSLAEEQLYLEYQCFAEDKISFFVSHRLTSTRFCNRILFMEQGVITENGTHQELLNLHQQYWKMYKIQGFYYQKEGSDE